MFAVVSKSENSIVVKYGFAHTMNAVVFTIKADTKENMLHAYLVHMKSFISQSLDYLAQEVNSIQRAYREAQMGDFFGRDTAYWQFNEKKLKAQNTDTIKAYIDQFDGFDFSWARKCGQNTTLLAQDIIHTINTAKKVVAKTDEMMADFFENLNSEKV